MRTRAEKDGDAWIVNGHKVWTTQANFAKWMILVARTSNDHKYKGLTYFLCPVASTKGVTVRPLVKITGELGFNEVFLENVAIPDSMRLDQVGLGWTVAMTTLMSERGAAESAGSSYNVDDTVDRLISLAKRTQRNGERVLRRSRRPGRAHDARHRVRRP